MNFRKHRRSIDPPKARKKSRVGKLGTVRLAGPDMTALRDEVYLRSGGLCEIRFDGCAGYTPYKSGQLAHDRSRGAGGSDTAANTLFSCGHCHGIWHQYGPEGAKPCPPKPQLSTAAEGRE